MTAVPVSPMELTAVRECDRCSRSFQECSLNATCDHVTDLRRKMQKKSAAASAAAVAVIGGN